jgi:hypothetical protein
LNVALSARAKAFFLGSDKLSCFTLADSSGQRCEKGEGTLACTQSMSVMVGSQLN